MAYLTKSRFITALSCPTKLFYTGKKDYPNITVYQDYMDLLKDEAEEYKT